MRGKNIEINWLKEDIIKKLTSKKVAYYLGDDKEELTPSERLDKLLEHIVDLCDNSNQMEHLESEGVDNWENYSRYNWEEE